MLVKVLFFQGLITLPLSWNWRGSCIMITIYICYRTEQKSHCICKDLYITNIVIHNIQYNYTRGIHLWSIYNGYILIKHKVFVTWRAILEHARYCTTHQCCSIHIWLIDTTTALDKIWPMKGHSMARPCGEVLLKRNELGFEMFTIF